MSRVERMKNKTKRFKINKPKVLIEIVAVVFIVCKLYNVIDVSWWYLVLLVVAFNHVHYNSRKTVRQTS